MTNTLYGQLNLITSYLDLDDDTLVVGFPSSHDDLASLFHCLAELCEYQSDYFTVIDSEGADRITIKLKPGNSWDDLDLAMNQE